MEDKAHSCCLCSDKIVLPKIGEDKNIKWARCLSSSCFFDDDWKTCKFRKDLPLKENELICSSCLDKHPHDEVPVTCDLCSSKYESVYGPYQGWHCSSTVTNSRRFHDNLKVTREDCIIGEYGSTEYDLYKVWFVEERPKHIKLGFTVCDDCVSLLIYKGVCEQPTDDDRL
jgi:hypothetical protein